MAQVMNREMRRKLQRATKKNAGGAGVQLEGGPMDGWTVTSNAPALEPNWQPEGRYERCGEDENGIPRAEWVPHA
jgi:hypothetical protein